MNRPKRAADGSADVVTPRLARVRNRFSDGPQVWTLELALHDGQLTAFAPGQFNMLTAFGIGEVPISMSGSAHAPGDLLHTIRAVGPVSTALVNLQPGDMLGMRGPFGVGWPMKAAEQRDVVVVAGGLGLAPLRPALYHLLAERQRYGRIVLLYGSRSPEELLFRRQLKQWQRDSDFEVGVTVDHSTGAWHGQVGVVTTLIARARLDPDNTLALVCGPELMMRFAVLALKEAGLDDQQLYISMERNMKCAVGLCGHCQFARDLVCRDGPVFRFDRVSELLDVKEL